MRRREFIALLGATAVWPLGINAQQPAEKVPRIGMLLSGSSNSFAHRIVAFREGLRDLGYIDGRNIVIEYRFAEGRFERLSGLAADLVHRNIDVIVTMGTPATLAARQASSATPIVMADVGEAVGAGLVASLARPGGNITGNSYLFRDLVTKRLELLKEILPKATEVAVLWNPTNPAQQQGLDGLDVAARSLKVRLHFVATRDPSAFESVFSDIVAKAADALVVLDDGLFIFHRTQIASLALQRRLATVYGLREQVEAGGLIAYGPSFSDLARRAASYVDKILKGAKPADLPVEQPTKFELVINLKTAKALGLTIPQSILVRADEVIE